MRKYPIVFLKNEEGFSFMGICPVKNGSSNKKGKTTDYRAARPGGEHWPGRFFRRSYPAVPHADFSLRHLPVSLETKKPETRKSYLQFAENISYRQVHCQYPIS
jgi:hypothetical protein